jgi:hypothetical protein
MGVRSAFRRLVEDVAQQSKKARAKKAVDAREQKAGRRKPILGDASSTKIPASDHGKPERIRTKASKQARTSERKVKHTWDESSRAMVAAKIANLSDGQRADRVASQICEAVSQQDAADLLNVGKRSVEYGREVLDHGTPELVQAVEREGRQGPADLRPVAGVLDRRGNRRRTRNADLDRQGALAEIGRFAVSVQSLSGVG